MDKHDFAKRNIAHYKILIINSTLMYALKNFTFYSAAHGYCVINLKYDSIVIC